ncbi:BON domain-containing protein [Ramlibacter sp. AN1015]|uniref:BON domain-containing protein n=1 Tax=Ramlibacter sp. AN1015 TaxID=3133428 RepID=UPI0030C48395
MKHMRIHHAAAASSVAVLFALAGCGDRGADTADQAIVPAPQQQSQREPMAPPASETGTAPQQSAPRALDQHTAAAPAGQPDAYHGNMAANNVVPERRPDTSMAGAGAAGSPDANRADERSDMQLTARVNAQLAQDEELSAMRIDVDTNDGRVTLKGPVRSDEAKQRAERLAREVEGVAQVDNELEVKEASATPGDAEDRGQQQASAMGAGSDAVGSRARGDAQR